MFRVYNIFEIFLNILLLGTKQPERSHIVRDVDIDGDRVGIKGIQNIPFIFFNK